MIQYKQKDRKLVVVSNRLPFYREVDKRGVSSLRKAAGGLITAMEPVIIESGGMWLGWDGHSQKNNFENFSLTEAEGGGYKIGCIPITSEEEEAYYTRFSNTTLWSLFHYFFEKCSLDYESWEVYKKINRRFAYYIDQVASEDDVVWIQDYHLFLVPQYLRELRQKQEIHFFLHIPFPHFDIFSILPWQQKIIESLLCCQTVGFHHKQYLKNFEGAVEKYCLETGKSDLHSRFYSNFISVDFDKIDAESRKSVVIKKKEDIRSKFAGNKMILGVDRIDYSKGIKERLLALESFLEEFPELRGKFIYYQLVVPSRESVASYRSLKREIDEIVGRIEGNYSTSSWSPIFYHYGSVPFEDLIALYLAADIALVTPLRDGMNLVCKEYIAAHSDNDGVLILSKFAGASAEIKSCLTVNPYSIKEIKDTLYRAFHLPKEERKRKMIEMRQSIRDHTIFSWLNTCLKYFEEVG